MARLIIACLALATVSLQPLKTPGRPLDKTPAGLHPHVFAMVVCWPSDTGQPVVTEINLDAVEQNRNQFPQDKVKQRDSWFEYVPSEGGGFERYRLLAADNGRFIAEFQQNSGGTLTSVFIVQFMITSRELQQSGRTDLCRVLRVLGCKSP
jgi:hypothetical protein